MNTRVQNTSELFEVLRTLRTEWPSRGWSWDTRLSCVASSIPVELAGQARTAALHALPHAWNEKSLARAPRSIQDIAEQTGGVREDQLLMARQSADGVLAYGLWWPWRNQITISFRLGLFGRVSSRLEMDLMNQFDAYL